MYKADSPQINVNNIRLIQYSQRPPVALMRRLHRRMKQMSKARSVELLAAHLPFITDVITKHKFDRLFSAMFTSAVFTAVSLLDSLFNC